MTKKFDMTIGGRTVPAEAGTVFINKHAEIVPNIPFGGIKCSGIGVEFGQAGLEAYTTIKVINAAA